MPHFDYRARDVHGALLHGLIEAADSAAAASILAGRGMTPIDIKASHAVRAATSTSLSTLFDQRIKPVDLMMFSRQMHTLLRAGVPIMRALTGLQASTRNKALELVIADLRESLDAGREFAVALGRHPRVFSPFYVHMVRVGEMTGRLDEIFLRMFHHLEFEKYMREQVRAALRYPSFVVATMAAALVVINVFVIPSFARVYKGFNAKLPAVTQLLIDISGFVVAAWPMMLAGTIAAWIGFRYWVSTPSGRLRWDAVKLQIPIAGKIAQKATLGRFARSFSLALRSGVPLSQALSAVAQTVENDLIAYKIERMREGVERGESVLRTAGASRVFTPIVLQMIAVGEESGALDELMTEIADMYQREVEYELKTLSSQIEPVLIICLAGLVLVLALGVFLPIWDLGQAIAR
jgi:MSHA biogenesis protein MshG